MTLPCENGQPVRVTLYSRNMNGSEVLASMNTKDSVTSGVKAGSCSSKSSVQHEFLYLSIFTQNPNGKCFK